MFLSSAMLHQNVAMRMLQQRSVREIVLANKVTFSSFDLWFFVQQRWKQMPVKRNGGKTWSRLVKKKTLMTKEKVGSICFACIASICSIATTLF